MIRIGLVLLLALKLIFANDCFAANPELSALKKRVIELGLTKDMEMRRDDQEFVLRRITEIDLKGADAPKYLPPYQVLNLYSGKILSALNSVDPESDPFTLAVVELFKRFEEEGAPEGHQFLFPELPSGKLRDLWRKPFFELYFFPSLTHVTPRKYLPFKSWSVFSEKESSLLREYVLLGDRSFDSELLKMALLSPTKVFNEKFLIAMNELFKSKLLNGKIRLARAYQAFSKLNAKLDPHRFPWVIAYETDPEVKASVLEYVRAFAEAEPKLFGEALLVDPVLSELFRGMGLSSVLGGNSIAYRSAVVSLLNTPIKLLELDRMRLRESVFADAVDRGVLSGADIKNFVDYQLAYYERAIEQKGLLLPMYQKLQAAFRAGTSHELKCEPVMPEVAIDCSLLLSVGPKTEVIPFRYYQASACRALRFNPN